MGPLIHFIVVVCVVPSSLPSHKQSTALETSQNTGIKVDRPHAKNIL